MVRDTQSLPQFPTYRGARDDAVNAARQGSNARRGRGRGSSRPVLAAGRLRGAGQGVPRAVSSFYGGLDSPWEPVPSSLLSNPSPTPGPYNPWSAAPSTALPSTPYSGIHTTHQDGHEQVTLNDVDGYFFQLIGLHQSRQKYQLFAGKERLPGNINTHRERVSQDDWAIWLQRLLNQSSLFRSFKNAIKNCKYHSTTREIGYR